MTGLVSKSHDDETAQEDSVRKIEEQLYVNSVNASPPNKQAENFIRTFTLKVEDENSSTDRSTILEPESPFQSSSSLSVDEEEETSGNSFVEHSPVVANCFRRIISAENYIYSDNEEREIEGLLENLKVKFKLMDNTENNEGRVRFKATPVPIHCQELRFEEMMKCKRLKSAEAKQKRIEEVSLSVKPFSFSHVNLKRTNSAPVLLEIDAEPLRGSSTFRAKPVPKFVTDITVREKIRQEEGFRKLKIKIRSEELLRTSVAPIPVRTKTGHRKSMVNFDNPKLICVKHPPDFKLLHFKLAKELGRNKSKHMSTVCQPFNLTQSYNLKQNNHSFQIIKSPEKDGNDSRRSASPIPTKMTKAVRLRDNSNK